MSKVDLWRFKRRLTWSGSTSIISIGFFFVDLSVSFWVLLAIFIRSDNGSLIKKFLNKFVSNYLSESLISSVLGTKKISVRNQGPFAI